MTLPPRIALTPRIALPAEIDPAAFVGHDRTAPIVELCGETMGTTWRVLFAARVPPPVVRGRIEARLAELVAQLSNWDRASALSRFNDAPANSWVALPPDLARVVEEGLAIAAVSDGAFDPAVGVLVNLWGFGPAGPQPPPTPVQVTAALERSGFARMGWRPADASLFQPGGVQLDLSGIAKGYAVDAIVDLLATCGIRHCLVEVGGELSGRGIRPDGEPWWVDLELPDGACFAPLRVAMHGQAVATSGTYVRGGHNLDPRTGSAPRNGVVSVSVVAPTAMRADALASAALVAYPYLAAPAFDGVAMRLIVAREGGYDEIVTAPLAAMLD
ncbi:thiamine biosynthesis lipoprotein [Sphingomonas gellani]|uniref:FAD:protein FMN transferase n=1 Tax=Sphingomonas gellani TaxID=1166340 RepID=A0A1H8DDI0_9SPHN|nr:thiamine biosynthesis lipoprotein [Sphingomonas gellani]